MNGGTLDGAIAKETVYGCCLAAAVIAGVAGVVDVVERFRDLVDRTDLTAMSILAIALARLPKILETAAPFAILLGAVWAFAGLQRRSELTVARSAGLPIWRVAAPGAVVAGAAGLLTAGAWNPLASSLQDYAERAAVAAGAGRSDLVAVEDEGLWLLDASSTGRIMIRARRSLQGGVILRDATFFLFDPRGALVRRHDAASARLRPGGWRLEDVRTLSPEGTPEKAARLSIPSSLNADALQRGVARADALSIWSLPGFISRADAAGFDVREHRYVLHKAWASPVLFAAMALIAGALCAGRARERPVFGIIAAALGGGFALYFLTTMAEALGRSGAAPAGLAAWGPAVAALAFAATALLHADDL